MVHSSSLLCFPNQYLLLNSKNGPQMYRISYCSTSPVILPSCSCQIHKFSTNTKSLCCLRSLPEWIKVRGSGSCYQDCPWNPQVDFRMFWKLQYVVQQHWRAVTLDYADTSKNLLVECNRVFYGLCHHSCSCFFSAFPPPPSPTLFPPSVNPHVVVSVGHA